jgi:uncharacterized membrane protein
MLGLAVAAKFYPLFLAGGLIALALRTGRVRAAAITIGTGAARGRRSTPRCTSRL